MGTVYHWASPDVVGRMTLVQLMMYMSDADGSEQRPKGAFKNRKEMLAYIEKMNADKAGT